MLELNPKTQALLDGGTCVATASRQRAVALRLAHAAGAVRAGRSVWKSPDVLAWGGWLEREWSREPAGDVRLLRPAEEWLLWREVAAQASRDATPLFRNSMTVGLRRAAALVGEWAIPRAALDGLPGSEALLLRRALLAFERRCEEGGLLAPLHLAARLAQRAQPAPALHFAGCAPLSPMQRRFQPKVLPGAGRAARTRLATAIDRDHELELIGEWAHAQLAADPARRLLVVLPDLAQRGAALARVLRGALAPGELVGFEASPETPAFALEGGEPLGSYPLVAHALEGLAACVEPLEFGRLSAWLRAPFGADPGVAERARIDLWLRGRGRTVLDLRQLMEELRGASPAECPGGARLRERLRAAHDALGRGTGSLRLWAERFRAALAALGFPGVTGLASADTQLLARFVELLREVGSIGLATHAMGAREALELLREVALEVAFEPASGDTPVTVTDAIGDPVVGYDGIWVAGLQAEAWPPPARPDPFIPWRLQQAAGLPQASAAGQLRRAEAALEDWRCAAHELVLSHARQVDDARGTPSPLLAGLGAEPLAPRGRLVSVAARLRREQPLEEVVDARGPLWPAGRALPAGTRALELQNQCAFRAFAELRLGAVPLEVPVRGIDPRARGRLLHRALEMLWQELGGSLGLAATDDAGLEVLIERRVREAAREILDPAAGDPDPRVSEREIRRAVRLIAELCTLERGRPAFTVEAVELACRLEVDGARLDLRLDRVDRLEDGTRVIIDYKSGRPAGQQWLTEPLSHPQLLAYLLAVPGAVAALATAHLARTGVEFRGVAAAPGLLPKLGGEARGAGGGAAQPWEDQLERWRAVARRLIGDFVAGEAAVAPAAAACELCHLHGFCRIDELDATATNEPAGDESGSDDD